MTSDVKAYGTRKKRPESVKAAADNIWSAMLQLRGIFGSAGKWSVLDSGFEAQPVRNAGDVELAFEQSVPLRSALQEPGAPTYSVAAFLRAKAKTNVTDIVHLQVLFSPVEEALNRPNFYFEATIKKVPSSEKGYVERVRRAATELTRTLRPDWVTASPPKGPKPLGYSEKAPRVGWLTYLSKSLGPLPTIPPPTEVVPIDDLGFLLIAQPDPVDPSNKDHQASLAYVRHALGVRALRDGPSFPPPGQENTQTVVEKVVPAAVAPAAVELPSYLKPKVADADNRGGASTKVGAPQENVGLPGEVTSPPEPNRKAEVRSKPKATVALAAMLVPSPSEETLPFDPAAKPDALPSQGPQFQSGQTAEVDVDAIRQGVAALQKARSLSVQPSSLATPSASPPPPSSVIAPFSGTGTTEVDVAAIARGVAALQAVNAQSPSPQSPSTQSPSTQSPSTQSPSTQSPSTQSPSTQSPSTPQQGGQPPSTLSQGGATQIRAVSERQPSTPPGTRPAPPGKRWRKFNPQTGLPLAEPVLEDIPTMALPAFAPPVMEAARRPPPDTEYRAETRDIDPDMIAEILRQTKTPFEKKGG